ncbi:hypothetical protein C8Q78DRAFT_605490 [Trametes maxima]|nr:hypothetical protein C8Q78DRAFT_605490 [Trametes maxima]
MRLIHLINETQWRFHEVTNPNTVPYAILSHVWDYAGDGTPIEPTYQDLLNATDFLSPARHGDKFSKLREFCRIAFKHKYSFVWADMCCIDKTSSTELSEALASMYHWYRCASVCYAYLRDVPTVDFSRSVWFERGWTLQELIAPISLVFLSGKWVIIGSRDSYAPHISSITNIPSPVLTQEKDVHTFSVACRMSWAAKRKTTKPEDRAYSLMGLFGVRLPVLYGDGSYAFIRLQEEILRRIPDPTLFAWGTSLSYKSDILHIFDQPHVSCLPFTTATELHVRNPSPSDPGQRHRYLLAASPDDFCYSGLRLNSKHGHFDSSPITIAPARSLMRGGGPPSVMIDSFNALRMTVPLAALSVDRQTNPQYLLAFLGCENAKGEPLALFLSRGGRGASHGRSSDHAYWIIGGSPADAGGTRSSRTWQGTRGHCRLVALPKQRPPRPYLTTVGTEVWEPELVEPPTGLVVFPLSPPTHDWNAGDPGLTIQARRALRLAHETFEVELSEWCKAKLKGAGIGIEAKDPHTFVLSPCTSVEPGGGRNTDATVTQGSRHTALKIRLGICDNVECSWCRRRDRPPSGLRPLVCSIREYSHGEPGNRVLWQPQDHVGNSGSWRVLNTTAVTTRRFPGTSPFGTRSGAYMSVRLRSRLSQSPSPPEGEKYILEIETSAFDPSQARPDHAQETFYKQLSTNDAYRATVVSDVPGAPSTSTVVTVADPPLALGGPSSHLQVAAPDLPKGGAQPARNGEVPARSGEVLTRNGEVVVPNGKTKVDAWGSHFIASLLEMMVDFTAVSVLVVGWILRVLA